MKHLFSVVGLACLLSALGCHHIGGKCDCVKQTGDNSSYTNPGIGANAYPSSMPSKIGGPISSMPGGTPGMMTPPSK